MIPFAFPREGPLPRRPQGESKWLTYLAIALILVLFLAFGCKPVDSARPDKEIGAPLAAELARPEAGGLSERAVLANLSAAPRGPTWVSLTLAKEAWAPGDAVEGPGGIRGRVGDRFGIYATAHVLVPALRALEFREVSLRRSGAASFDPVAPRPVAPEGGGVESSPASPAPSVLRVSNGSESVSPFPQFSVAPHSGVYLHVGRVGMLVVETWFQLLPGSPLVPFEVLVTNSDPRVDRNEVALDLRVETPASVRPVLDYARQRGFATSFDGQRWEVRVLRSAIGDRQSVQLRGRLHLLDLARASAGAARTLAADLEGPAVGLSLDWKDRWGPWLLAPRLGVPATDAQVAALVGARWRAFVGRRVSVWDRGVRAKQAGITGHDRDYGPTKGLAVLAGRRWGPASLFALGLDAVAEAGRPQQIYEATGAPVRVEDHPRLFSWGFRPHYRANLSDQLGKSSSRGLHDWQAMSFSHASSNGLAAFAILARSRASQRLLQHQGTWIRARRKESWGQTRASGRVMNVAAWVYLATGDRALLDYFAGRWDSEYDAYLARAREVEVAPWAWTKARSDWPLWPKESWIPWQEAIFARGLDGLLGVYERRVGPHAKAAEARGHLLRTVVDHGFYRLDGRWVVGYQIARLPGDRALTAAEYQDPTVASPHYGTAVDWWSIPSAPIYERVGASARATELRRTYERRLAELPFAFRDHAEWLSVR